MREVVLTRGLVIGSYAELRRGQAYLLEFARHYAGELIVVLVQDSKSEIPNDLNQLSMQKAYPGLKVVSIQKTELELAAIIEGGYDQEEIEFSTLFARGNIDFLFADSSSQRRIAEAIGAQFIPIDPVLSRNSNTDMEPSASFCPPSPTDFESDKSLKKICIFGPESTGKSTLAKNLALRFETVFVPEYARTYLDFNNNELSFEQFKIFARGQIASEKALSKQANRVIFCDTDPITTSIWSNWLYGRCDQSIENLAEACTYDLYLVANVDVPWVSDPQRYLPGKRQEFLERCLSELVARNRHCRLISGDWEERFNSAVRVVNELLVASPKTVSH